MNHLRSSIGGRIPAVFFVILMGLTAPLDAAEGRILKPLDGAWTFKLDPDKIGERDRWFSAQVPFQDTIFVPGAWDVQGFGEETEKLHFNFIGKAWYKKEIAIPEEWEGRRLFLTFGGVYRYAKIWVNDHYLGEHIGYVSNFEFEISEQAQPGTTAVIALEIDSEQRWDVDTLAGVWDMGEGMNTFWGGIWGHVTLEAKAVSWLDDLYIQPHASLDGCRVTASLNGDDSLPDEVKLDILDATAKVVFSKKNAIKQRLGSPDKMVFDACLPEAELWTTGRPYLYTARLSLLGQGKVLDHVETRFGLRIIEFQGTDILVNGKKVFLSGYGDDGVYPRTMVGPSDKGFYLENLKVAKSYGFNYVRHHSHFMPPEYYEACDEVGMFVSPELPIAYAFYYSRAGEAALELYKTEWIAAVKRYRNHPSIFNWGMGNEMRRGIPLGAELYKLAKELDPGRPVIDTDGLLPIHGFGTGDADRDTLDFFTVQFNVFTTPLDNPGKFSTGHPKKPMIAHEMGNYITFPRLDVIDSFQHNIKPFWLTPLRDRLQEIGLLDEAPKWSEKSEKLYYLCHKINTEALRKNPLISGYHWWLLQPWWACSDGLLDIYRRPTSIKPEDVRRFNGPVVLLEEGLELSYRGKNKLEIELLMSNYSGRAIDQTSLRYEVRTDTAVLRQGTLPVSGVNNGDLADLGTVSLILPDPQVPQRVTVEVQLENQDEIPANSWSTWIYPAGNPSPDLDVPLFASEDLLDLLADFNPQSFPLSKSLAGKAVCVARQPTPALLEAAAAGCCVILLSPVDIFPLSWTSFKTAWWNGAIEGNSNTGTLVYDHSVTRDIAPEGWCDASWFRLLEGAQTYILDDFPAQPDVLIRALESHDYPLASSIDADFGHRWKNKSLLFQFGVGEGSMIVSGLNFDVSLRHGGPEGAWLLSQLFTHAGKFSLPKVQFPIEVLRDRITDSLFTRGPLVSGFNRLIQHKGEKKTGLSYRELEAPLLKIHQGRHLHRLEWETAPAVKAERVIFVFSGGIPAMFPPPVHPGFTLTIDGKKILHFDTSRGSQTWLSPDKAVALIYVPRPIQISLRETRGVFYISIPADRLVPGQPCRLGVHPRGGAYARWFGLNTYRDVLGPER